MPHSVYMYVCDSMFKLWTLSSQEQSTAYIDCNLLFCCCCKTRRALSSFCTFVISGYVDALMDLLFTRVVHNQPVYEQLSAAIAVPPSLCSTFEHPDKSEAVARVTTRFSGKGAAAPP